MKGVIKRTSSILSLLCAAIGLHAAKAQPTLDVHFNPVFRDAPLVFDEPTNSTAAGQQISVTRLDFLVSGFALRRQDGIWFEDTNSVEYISARQGRTRFHMKNIPPGNYDRVRFRVGVPPELNHSNPAQWPPGHALHPEVNGLHWSWMGGYVFLAMEGRWRSPDSVNTQASLSGYSWHLATDRMLMAVELPIALAFPSHRELRVALNVDTILNAPDAIVLNEANATTHSRAQDALADQLRRKVEAAFDVMATGESSSASAANRPEPRTRESGTQAASGSDAEGVLIASNATPYRLIISQFFPRPDLPCDNPITVEGVSLGSELFFDPRLSANNRQSCATCHRPPEAFSDNRRFSRGIGGELGTRNSMPLLNLAWKKEFFWDGRAQSLREQVLQPIQNPIEMHESLEYLVVKLSRDTNYHRLFANAFGTAEITTNRIARALEQFLLAQISQDSKFDRVLSGRDKFSEAEQRGFELFHTEYDPRRGQYGADCFHCHGGPLFQSQSFANNGLDSTFNDAGRYDVTKREGDRGKFSVPSLRNVEATGPYMHDGRFSTLEDAVGHYTTGVKRSTTLDPNLAKHPDGGVPLSKEDQAALVAFLKTLTDERFRSARTDPVPGSD